MTMPVHEPSAVEALGLAQRSVAATRTARNGQ